MNRSSHGRKDSLSGRYQGGLIGRDEVTRRFVRVLKSALECARLCAGDPLCADHDPITAADDRTLHGAACDGCLLVSETSCQARNVFLDCALMIDTVGSSGAGFFKVFDVAFL
jgi:hypothetical protein